MGYKKNKEPYPHELRVRNLQIYDWLVKDKRTQADVARQLDLTRQRIFSICKEVERLNELE